MTLPLLLLVLAARPGVPSPGVERAFSSRTESASAVDVSAAQRFGWVEAAARRAIGTPEPLLRRAPQWLVGQAVQLFPIFRGEGDAAGLTSPGGREVAIAARWIDALPLKVDAQGGGLWLSFRLRGP